MKKFFKNGVVVFRKISFFDGMRINVVWEPR